MTASDETTSTPLLDETATKTDSPKNETKMDRLLDDRLNNEGLEESLLLSMKKSKRSSRRNRKRDKEIERKSPSGSNASVDKSSHVRVEDALSSTNVAIVNPLMPEMFSSHEGATASRETIPTSSTAEKPQTTLVDPEPATSAISPTKKDTVNAVESTHETVAQKPKKKPIATVKISVVPPVAFNVVLTHATADFDSLASAVGLAKLWTAEDGQDVASSAESTADKNFKSASHVPTFVVLPRGAHPGVQRFLALHKHLFPIRSLKSLPSDLSGLNRLALVDAQRRDRLGPADVLLEHANRVVVVDHHVDQDSDIPATDYVVDNVGSVSTLISEYLREEEMELSEAEATLLALGIHADTGSLCFDSTTPRDAKALAWCLEQGASQTAIAEHAHTHLSREQQSVLTQALINVNSTTVHGITLSTVLLSADGFINGLAAVTQDALELSSSDIFLLGMVYEATAGGRRKSKRNSGKLLTTRLLEKTKEPSRPISSSAEEDLAHSFQSAWKGGKDAQRRKELRAAFDRKDVDGSGFLDRLEVEAALGTCGIVATVDSFDNLMEAMDLDGNGVIDFEEFVAFATEAESRFGAEPKENKNSPRTLIVVGRASAGVSLRAVKLNKLLERFGGGGHAKAASATARLNDESEAAETMQSLVDELIETGLSEQPLVGDFMTAPALSVKADMNENQVEALFTRYDVRALPVVDEDNNVIGLVTYKEVASAKQRMFNKEQKRLRRQKEKEERGEEISEEEQKMVSDRRGHGTTVKAWMKQHVRVVEDSKTMAEVEIILLENDVGCIPVVAEGTNRLIGMVTRTDLLRQHRYYDSLHYSNPGFADSIKNRAPIIALRKKLKKFDDLDA